MSRRPELVLLSRTFLVLSLAAGADAVAQWDWKVTGYSNTFTSKADAVDFIHGLSSVHDKLRTERLDSMSTTAVTYKYSAPMVGPNLGAWYYTTQHAPGQQLASEAAAIEAVQDGWHDAVPQCPAPTVAAEGNWSTTGWWYGAWRTT